MASVSGSQLVFVSPNKEPVNLILNDGTTVEGATVSGAYNIEVFTTSFGTPLSGVDATALIGGAVTVSSSAVQAASLGSIEQLGTGDYTLIDDTRRHSSSQHQAPSGETIELGSGAQTVIGSSGDTVIGGDAGSAVQVIDLTGTDHLVTSGPMTAVGGAGSLLVEAGDGDSIAGGSGAMSVVAGSSDTISGGSGPTTVYAGGPNGRFHDDGHNGHHQGDDDEHDDRSENDRGNGDGFGNNTILGGAGPTTVYGGRDDLIQGGGGALTIYENPGASGSGETIAGGSGNLVVYGAGRDELITGGSGTNFIEGEGTGGDSSITGGTGSVTGAGGQAVNTLVISDRGDTVTGSTGSLSVDGGSGHATINAGLGGTTVDGGDRDVINNLGSGTLLVDIYDRTAGHGHSASLQGSGSETVNLGAGHGMTTVSDVSVAGGTGRHAETTVTGFDTFGDVVASQSSVDAGGNFEGTSKVVDGNTVLTFLDGSRMTLVGIANIGDVNFTQ